MRFTKLHAVGYFIFALIMSAIGISQLVPSEVQCNGEPMAVGETCTEYVKKSREWVERTYEEQAAHNTTFGWVMLVPGAGFAGLGVVAWRKAGRREQQQQAIMHAYTPIPIPVPPNHYPHQPLPAQHQGGWQQPMPGYPQAAPQPHAPYGHQPMGQQPPQPPYQQGRQY